VSLLLRWFRATIVAPSIALGKLEAINATRVGRSATENGAGETFLDEGIDLIACTGEGKHWAIQAKFPSQFMPPCSCGGPLNFDDRATVAVIMSRCFAYHSR
jgi:hypothetical protein